MIVRSNLRTSLVILLPHVGWKMLVACLYAGLIYYLYEHHKLEFLSSFGFLPVSFLGTVLSVFLAFRNNHAYGRWWEARRHWGALVNQSRYFAAQISALLLASEGRETASSNISSRKLLKQEFIYRHLAFIEQMQHQLHGQAGLSQGVKQFSPDDVMHIDGTPNPAVRLLQIQSENLGKAAEWGYWGEFQLMTSLEVQERFYTIIGSCERIKNTPFPLEYDNFIQLLLWVLILLLPVYLLGLFSDDLSKILVIPISALLVFIVEFANHAGKVMEDPFENKIHDIPMSALINTIERDLLSLLPEGHGELPEKLQSHDGVLW